MSKGPPETADESTAAAATPKKTKQRTTSQRPSRRYRPSGPDRDWREKAKGQIAIVRPERPGRGG
jgi:hypothetical protein